MALPRECCGLLKHKPTRKLEGSFAADRSGLSEEQTDGWPAGRRRHRATAHRRAHRRRPSRVWSSILACSLYENRHENFIIRYEYEYKKMSVQV